jgi:hypothetical protein
MSRHFLKEKEKREKSFDESQQKSKTMKKKRILYFNFRVSMLVKKGMTMKWMS